MTIDTRNEGTMRNWLRDNVLYDRLQDLWAGGCLTVARWFAAACVLMIAGMVACGCARGAKGPAYPARDEVHAAMFSVIWGLRTLDKECGEISLNILKTGDYNRALFLAQSCDDRLAPAKLEMEPAVEALDSYGPDTARMIGCSLSATRVAFAELRPAMEARGQFDIDVDDGQARTEYLIGLAGGKCAK